VASLVRRGDLVEFADKRYTHYPPADTSLIRYGVAVEDQTVAGNPVKVALADRSTVRAWFIYSYAWAGWMPEALEPIWAELNPDTFQDFDPDDEYAGV
jgi:hypothetical protein